MQRLKMFEPLQVDMFEEAAYHLPTHNHTYYEIIYIYFGKGIHKLNNAAIPYAQGDLFLVAPEDQHRFDIAENTRFVYIKFTDAYFSQRKYFPPEAYFVLEPIAMMRHHFLKETTLVLGEECRFILKNTIDNILSYSCKTDLSASAIIFHQVLSIFALIKEAVSKAEGYYYLPDAENKNQLLSYIHENIYHPEKLQIKEVGAQFHIAPNYFSAYFKREFMVSFRDYINQYRAKLIERRVNAGQLTLKQIAAEFGFTDESHLSRFFKNQFSATPKEYRKSGQLASDVR